MAKYNSGWVTNIKQKNKRNVRHYLGGHYYTREDHNKWKDHERDIPPSEVTR